MDDELNKITVPPSVEQLLDMIEHKESLTEEQLKLLHDDSLCRSYCQTAEDICRVLSEKSMSMPDVDAEWEKFSQRATHPSPFTVGGDLQSPTPLTTHHSPLTLRFMGTVLAAVAVLLALFLFPWHKNVPSGELLANEQSKGQASEGALVIYEEQTEDAAPVTLYAAGRVIPIDKADKQSYQSALSSLTTSQDQTVVISIPRGTTYTTLLADGTQVWLNANSRLTYPASFDGQKERRVSLEGEAYFQVARNTAHPFVVEAAGASISVLGTEFYVTTHPSPLTTHPSPLTTLEVTLINGSIKVSAANNEKTLKPGQQLNVQSLTFNVQDVDTTPYVYWKNGCFFFDNVSIDRILTEIGQWYNVTVMLQDTTLLDYKFHFIADRSDNLDQIIDLLNQMDKVTIHRQGNTLYVK